MWGVGVEGTVGRQRERWGGLERPWRVCGGGGGGGVEGTFGRQREGERAGESWGGVGVEGALGRGGVGRRDSCMERVLRVCI